MERAIAEQKMSSTKPTKTAGAKEATKKQLQPLKVVYISNPLKLKASSASEFRALVQEVTGKDSDFADTLAKYSQHTEISSDSTTPISLVDRGKLEEDCCCDQEEHGFIEEELSFNAAFETFPMFLPSYNEIHDLCTFGRNIE